MARRMRIGTRERLGTPIDYLLGGPEEPEVTEKINTEARGHGDSRREEAGFLRVTRDA